MFFVPFVAKQNPRDLSADLSGVAQAKSEASAKVESVSKFSMALKNPP